jgi:hypothetical protein
VNGSKGVAHTALVSLVALLSVLLTVDVVSAQPAPPVGRSKVWVEHTEPMRDMCAERHHDSRHSILPAPSPVPMSAARSGSASANADGADDDEVPDALATLRAAGHVVPLRRSGQLAVVLQVFRC